MKSHPELFPVFRKFQRDPKKTYTRKFRIYPSFLYFRLDHWLNRMSLSGHHVVDCRFGFFLFEQGTPDDRRYFTYDPTSPRRDGGMFSLTMRYPFPEKTYGIRKKRSALNRNEGKTCQIIKLDAQKIQSEQALGYRELVHDRNRLYALRAVRNAAILTVFVMIACLLRTLTA